MSAWDLTPENREKFIKLWHQGEPASRICAATGVKSTDFTRVRAKLELEPRKAGFHGRVSRETREWVLGLILLGKSNVEIATLSSKTPEPLRRAWVNDFRRHNREKVEALQRGQPVAGPKAVRRHCLMCRNEFESRHIGERICGDCKDTVEWKAGGDFGFHGDGGRRVPARHG